MFPGLILLNFFFFGSKKKRKWYSHLGGWALSLYPKIGEGLGINFYRKRILMMMSLSFSFTLIDSAEVF